MNRDENRIGGYEFEDLMQAKRAEREVKGIEQLNDQLKNKKIPEILEIYNNVIDKKIFKTPVGYEYLKGVQRKLKNSTLIKNEDIRPVFIAAEKPKVIEEKSDGSLKLKKLQLLNIVLIIVIISMFVISFLSRDKFDEEKYINSIEDRYSSWEKELNERESILNERENK